MSTNIVILPLLIPLVTGIILIFFGDNVRAQRWIAATGLTLGLASSVNILVTVQREGIKFMTASNWPAPFGIVLVADMFSAIMSVTAMILALVVLFYSFAYIDEDREKHYYYPLFMFLLLGVNGSFLTGDIFNLFVWFEVLLISSYILVTIGSESFQLREGFRYMALNIVGSTMFLVAVAVLYGMTGTLNMADLSVKVSQIENQGLVTVVAMVFLFVFGMKGAVFPLYFWMTSYFAPPTPITALFGGLLTKVGVYAIIRVFTLIFINDIGFTHLLLIVIGVFTMVLGVLAAVSQMDFKRILTYHIISQIGYMIMGVGIYTGLALAGAVFFVVHNIIVKSSLFLISGATEKVTGTTDLHKMSGLMSAYPFLAGLFFIAGISLAGAPPFSGFFGKFALIKAGFEAGQFWAIGISIAVSLLTLFSMMKIFRYAFWGEKSGIPEDGGQFTPRLLPPILALIALTVVIGIGSNWFFQYFMISGEQLMDPSIYVNAVLKGL